MVSTEIQHSTSGLLLASDADHSSSRCVAAVYSLPPSAFSRDPADPRHQLVPVVHRGKQPGRSSVHSCLPIGCLPYRPVEGMPRNVIAAARSLATSVWKRSCSTAHWVARAATATGLIATDTFNGFAQSGPPFAHIAHVRTTSAAASATAASAASAAFVPGIGVDGHAASNFCLPGAHHQVAWPA